ncbi:MAG: glycosyltransferase family 9 protein [Betaproteobacteria bacterium]
MRVLIVKRDKLGDLLLSTGVIEHLKASRPDLEVHLLVNDYNAWVARDEPALARTWVYPRVRHAGRMRVGALLAQVPLAWKLRRAAFDWAIAMGGEESPRAVRRAIATGARRVVAYADDPTRYGPRLTDPLPIPAHGHEIARMLSLLAPLRVEPPARMPVPVYRFPPEGDAFANGWLAERGLATGRYIVLGIGTRFAQRQPSVEQVLRWTARFSEHWDLPTVFLWTPGNADAGLYPGDDPIAARVLARPLPYLHAQRGTLQQALALIAHARVSIMPDSGLMHFAAASPGGVVGLFADPAEAGAADRWGPVGPRARFLQAQNTITELSDESVMAALEPLVSRGPAPV